MITVGSLVATLDLDSRRYVAGLRAADVGLRTFEKSVGSSSAVIQDFATLIGGIGLSRLAAEAVMAGENFLNLDRKVAVLSNSLVRMGQQNATHGEIMAYLSETADKMAFEFDALAKTWVQLVPMAAANGVALETMNKALEGTIGMGSLMGASSVEMQRAFIAIRQVVGKNRLQMEELRGQLGEAMPNAMLILAEGLTKIGFETDEFGNKVEITTAKLNQLITAGKVDGATFMRAWAAGVEEAAKFAEARSMMLSGQFVVLKNIFQRDVGRFMMESGLNQYFAGVLRQVNEGLRQFFSTASAQRFGDAFIRQFEAIVLGVARTVDTLSEPISKISEFIADTLRVFDTLPPEIKTWGLLGFIMLGKKGKVALVFATRFKEEIAALFDEARNMWENSIFGEWSEEGFLKVSEESLKQQLQRLGKSVIGDHIIENTLRRELKLPETLIDTILDKTMAVENKVAHMSAAIAGHFAELDRLQTLVPDIDLFDEEAVNEALASRAGADWERLNAVTGQARQHIEQINAIRTAMRGLAFSIHDPAQIDPLIELFTGYINEADARIAALGDTENEQSRIEIANLQRKIELYQGIINGLVDIQNAAGAGAAAADSLETVLRGVFADAKGFAGVTTRAYEEALRAQDDLLKRVSEGKEPLLENVMPASIEAAIKKWHNLYNAIGEDVAVRTVMRDFHKLAYDILDPLEQAYIRVTEAAFGFHNMLGTIALNNYLRAAERLAQIDLGSSIASITKNGEAAAAALGELIDLAGSDELLQAELTKAGMDPAELIARIEAQLAALRKRMADAIASEEQAALRAAERAMNRLVAIARGPEESMKGALDAYILFAQDRAQFDALARQEAFEIANGLKVQEATLYALTQERRAELVIENELRELGAERIRQQFESAFLADARVLALRAELDLEDQILSNRKARIDLEVRRAEEMQRALLEAERLRLDTQIQQSHEELTFGMDEGVQRRLIELERAKIAEEYRNLLLQQQVLHDPVARQMMLETEMEKLRLERTNLELELQAARDPDHSALETELELMREKVDLQRLYNEYTRDLGTFLELNAVEGIQRFVSIARTGIMDILTGTKSLRDGILDMIAAMIDGIIEFFVTWGVQQAAAWMMQKLGLISTTATAVGAAGTLAAAWMTPAYLASVATLGAAPAIGLSALTAGMSSATALGILSATPGGVAPVPRAEGGPVDPSQLYLVGEQGPELFVPDKKGTILPAGMTADLIGGMSRAALAMAPAGAGTARIDDDMVAAMSEERVQVINYFDFQEVERHLARNPAAILNVIVQDERNNGVMRRRR